MTTGLEIALGIALIVGGSVGYEYRSAIGQFWFAAFEVCVIFAGMWFVANAIDALVQS